MRNVFILGAAIGAAIGAVVLTGYAAAGWWVCSSLTDCPAHWLPYLVVWVIGVAGMSLVAGGIAAGLRGMYRMTRVDVDGDGDGEADAGATPRAGTSPTAEAGTDADANEAVTAAENGAAAARAGPVPDQPAGDDGSPPARDGDA